MFYLHCTYNEKFQERSRKHEKKTQFNIKVTINLFLRSSSFLYARRSIAIAANLPRTEAGQRKLSGGNGKTHCERIDGHRFPAHIRGIKSLVQEIRGARLSHRNGQRDCHQSRKGCYARTTDLPLSLEWSRKFAPNMYFYFAIFFLLFCIVRAGESVRFQGTFYFHFALYCLVSLFWLVSEDFFSLFYYFFTYAPLFYGGIQNYPIKMR